MGHGATSAGNPPVHHIFMLLLIVSICYFVDIIHTPMFYFLSKIILVFLSPISWIILIFLGIIFLKKHKTRKILVITGLSILAFFSNGFIANEMLLLWEPKPKIISELDVYDVGIVLTGIINTGKMPKDRTFFNKGADRLIHATQLYKLGKIKKILITGSAINLVGVTQNVESVSLYNTLLFFGVPAEDILVETKAKNTRENAVFSAEILNDEFPGQKYLLITSAFHMPRSQACFKKAGLEFDTFPVDYYSIDSRLNFQLFYPSEYALWAWSILNKEFFGMITYRIAGYI